MTNQSDTPETIRGEGGCACGEIRYAFHGKPVFTAHCHCRDCQRASGAGAATVMAVPAEGFGVLRGHPKSYDSRGDSGQYVRRFFCGTCGSPLFSQAQVMPEVRFVRAVSLDDPSWVQPTAHIYCISAQPWDAMDDTLARFERLPS
ncbi:MAG: GFA family protein [Sinimarinibacterium flocculans]|uniref:GFA family protein n=1 Tax=Sinimarinibacterium flocculans TaxID=985250 RepID=UPI003C67BEF8